MEAAIAYIADDNVSAAMAFGETCVARAGQLAEFPRLGRPFITTPRGEIRELIIAPYRLLYRLGPDDNTAIILRVWHSARGTPQLP